MSAQASRIDSCEKEIKMLRRALDRSDIYVEELEKTIAAYRVKYGEIKVESYPGRSESEASEIVGLQGGGVIGSGVEGGEIGSGVEGDSGGTSGIRQRRRSSGKAVSIKQELIEDDDNEGDGESSFQLEQPSPVTPATSLQRLTLESNTKAGTLCNSSSSTSSTSTASSSSLRSCTRQLDFSFQNEASASQTDSQRSSILSIPNDDAQNTPTNLDSTLSNLDYSITPEFEACTKLLKAAEQRVHQRKQNSLEESSQELTSQVRVHQRKRNSLEEGSLASQPGSSAQSKVVDYKSSYILPDCDPTFQCNPDAASTSSEVKFDHQRQRPPSAPAAPSLLDTNTGASSLQSTVLSNTAVTSTRPKSAPLDSVQSLQVLQCQPHMYSSNLNMSSQPTSSSSQPTCSSSFLVQNPVRPSSYLTIPQSHASIDGSTQQNRHFSLQNLSVPLTDYAQSQTNHQTGGDRSQGLPMQPKKTVYVLSGSRIAPLGDRRKRSSESERRELRSSNLSCSPSKTQKM